MTEAIIVGLIAALATVISTLISAKTTQNKIDNSLSTNQAVTEAKLEALTREVREHNNFARRVPVMEEQIKVINHRIEDLERKV